MTDKSGADGKSVRERDGDHRGPRVLVQVGGPDRRENRRAAFAGFGKWDAEMPVEEDEKAVGGRNDEGSGIVVGRSNGRTELMTDRRNFLGGLAAASCLALAGCGTEYVDFSNPQSIGSSAGAIAKRLEAFTEDQRRAIYQGALSYLRNSSFGTEEEELDLSPLLAILKGRGNEPELPSWATTTRGRIQELIRKQLEDLPALLEQLEPKDRVAALTRLLPYTMNRGEGDSPTVTKL